MRCSRCIMDSSAKSIVFDENGICNFCTDALNELNTQCSNIVNSDSLNSLVKLIKKDGRNKKYDCIVGLSGGVDSSWTLLQVIKLGLRPLAVHFDNGWNSELAQNNIHSLVEKFKVDLYTYVVDWEEYRILMECFFEADVIDIELLYDNAMFALNHKIAKKYGVKYILSGSNTATEGVKLDISWNWNKLDKKNIKSIAKKFGYKNIKSLPMISTFEFYLYKYFFNIQWIKFLDYQNYDKQLAVKHLVASFGYKPYPYKHYENIFTRFYQAYILPTKFKVDKRLAHLSNLIITNKLSRDMAISMITNDPYPDTKDLESDKKYFLKKMNWDELRLNNYLARPEINHDFYGSENYLVNRALFVYKLFTLKILKN